MYHSKKIMRLMSISMLCAFAACSDANKQERVYTVVVTQPETSSIQMGEMSLPGVVKEAQNVKAAFKAAGQLMKVNVKEGDYVRQGQLLAWLDDADYKIGVNAAQAQYDQLKGELARITKLYEKGSVTANEYDKARYGLEQLKAQLDAKKNQLEYTRLYSPASGYVEHVNSHKGEMVDAGTTVLSIIDDTNMQVEVSIPMEVYEHRNQLGNFVAAIGGKKYDMSLVSITPKTDGTQMYKMLLAFPTSANSSIASGTNAVVDFTLIGEPSADSVSGISIPVSAIFYEGAQPCVWVVTEENTVDKRQVTLSTLNLDGQAVVVDGLSGTEKIVKAGVKHLSQGDKVEVLDREVKTNVGGQL